MKGTSSDSESSSLSPESADSFDSLDKVLLRFPFFSLTPYNDRFRPEKYLISGQQLFNRIYYGVVKI